MSILDDLQWAVDVALAAGSTAEQVRETVEQAINDFQEADDE